MAQWGHARLPHEKGQDEQKGPLGKTPSWKGLSMEDRGVSPSLELFKRGEDVALGAVVVQGGLGSVPPAPAVLLAVRRRLNSPTPPGYPGFRPSSTNLLLLCSPGAPREEKLLLLAQVEPLVPVPIPTLSPGLRALVELLLNPVPLWGTESNTCLSPAWGA